MALTAQTSVASLMRKTLDQQEAIAHIKLRFKKNQIEQILVNYIREGIKGPYNDLLKILREYPINDANYRILFEDCLTCVVMLDSDMKQFLDVLCNVEWASRGEELVEIFNKFVLSLVTAHTYHCPRVMTNLVKLFKAEDVNWDENDNPSQECVAKWSNIHTIIAQIVAIMPIIGSSEVCVLHIAALILGGVCLTLVNWELIHNQNVETMHMGAMLKNGDIRSSDLLMRTVIEQFPYHKAGCNANIAYIHNLIWISKYIPSLKEQIMTAVINRMIIMDVNIVDRSKNKAQTETMFDMDVDEQDDMSVTLDYCMMEILKWLEDERDPVLNIMCNVFAKVILPTYGIRHVQFLLLYAISINQQCADRVLNNLWAVAAGLHGLGPGALSTRRTAASHLAGLLARCVRVPNTRLIHYLRSMAEWCHSYITATQETTAASDNTKVHGAFYAVCHAIFYLVAFKHHHLFASKENVNFIESLNLPRLVTCPLNPLRTCPPQVTRAFSSVTRSHQVVYCQAIIERNARHTLQSTTLQQYDEWFPYDPYTLPKSGKIIWPLCIEYKDWSKDGDDETQYSGMKRKLDPEDDDYLIISPSQKLASSLSNCISPGFRTSENIMI